MKPEIKNYYTQHFGVFDPLTLNDIVEIGEYELSQINLPEVSYKIKENNFLPGQVSKHKEMQAVLQTVLELLTN
jgi:hypothetical protein